MHGVWWQFFEPRELAQEHTLLAICKKMLSCLTKKMNYGFKGVSNEL
jgi:hypothetical protein